MWMGEGSYPVPPHTWIPPAKRVLKQTVVFEYTPPSASPPHTPTHTRTHTRPTHSHGMRSDKLNDTVAMKPEYNRRFITVNGSLARTSKYGPPSRPVLTISWPTTDHHDLINVWGVHTAWLQLRMGDGQSGPPADPGAAYWDSVANESDPGMRAFFEPHTHIRGFVSLKQQEESARAYCSN